MALSAAFSGPNGIVHENYVEEPPTTSVSSTTASNKSDLPGVDNEEHPSAAPVAQNEEEKKDAEFIAMTKLMLLNNMQDAQNKDTAAWKKNFDSVCTNIIDFFDDMNKKTMTEIIQAQKFIQTKTQEINTRRVISKFMAIYKTAAISGDVLVVFYDNEEKEDSMLRSVLAGKNSLAAGVNPEAHDHFASFIAGLLAPAAYKAFTDSVIVNKNAKLSHLRQVRDGWNHFDRSAIGKSAKFYPANNIFNAHKLTSGKIRGLDTFWLMEINATQK